jgi:HEAT repeat protein
MAGIRPEPHHGAAGLDRGESRDLRATLALVEGVVRGASDLDASRLLSTIDLARDPHAALPRRVRAIRWLARFGDGVALAALQRLIEVDPHPTILLQAASALGDCPHPLAHRVLTSLLDDPREVVVVGALRALAARGDGDKIRAILMDPARSSDVRAAAALALRERGDANTTAVLLEAWDGAENADLSAAVLVGLGRQPFSETQEHFGGLVSSPNVRLADKINAVEALGESTPEAADFLLALAFDHTDETLRIAAIEALSSLEDSSGAVGRLSEILREHESLGVRSAAYAALTFHAQDSLRSINLAALLPQVRNETAPEVRLGAYQLVASILHAYPNAQLAEEFDSTMVPWLRREAESGSSLYNRRLSLNTLKLARTPGANAALRQFSTSTDKGVVR